MIRYFSFISLPTHLLILGLILLLHLPIFNSQYFLSSESLVLLCAQRLSESGGNLYVEAWLGHPPLIVWIYQAIYSLFQENTLLTIRILRCLYVYTCVVYISGFINSLRVQDRYNWVIPVSMAVLLSTPWYALESSISLFSLLPISYSFISLLKLENAPRKNANLQTMFWVGAWTMFYIFLSYKTFPLFLGLVLGYLLLRNSRLDELISLLGGMFVLFAGLCLALFFSETLLAFWDQGILFPWDRLVQKNGNNLYNSHISWLSIATNWGPWILLASLGFIHYRIKFYSYLAKVRLIERLMSIWLFFGLAGILMKGRSIESHDFILIIPPLSFYGAKVFDLKSKRIWKWGATVLTIVPPLLVFLVFWFPQSFSMPLSSVNSFFRDISNRSPIEMSEEQQPIYNFLAKVPKKEGIWILADWSDMYLRLKLPFPNKYVDFTMLQKKSLCWNPAEFLLSQKEPERGFFLHLSQNTPQLIADPHDLFPSLQACYPSLFSSYELVSDKEVLIYQRNP